MPLLCDDNSVPERQQPKATIESLLVALAKILITHRTGLLVLDEIQPENFIGPYSKELIAFFLRLLNFGVPVVLLGNPLGFPEQGTHAQTTRRWTAGGTFHLHPFVRRSRNWTSFIQHMIRFNLMPVPLVLTEEIDELFFDLSGGFPDFTLRLYIEAQRWALRLGDSKVEPKHLVAAYSSEKFAENHALIQGFAKKDASFLVHIEDVPHQYYAARWKNERDQESSDERISEDVSSAKQGGDRQLESPSISDAGKQTCEGGGAVEITSEQAVASDDILQSNARVRASWAAIGTKSNNMKLKNESLEKSLEDDDMRKSGAKNHRLSDFDDLRKRAGAV